MSTKTQRKKNPKGLRVCPSKEQETLLSLFWLEGRSGGEERGRLR
ncbi:unnamed protein product, partial [marine sediment metagenome]